MLSSPCAALSAACLQDVPWCCRALIGGLLLLLCLCCVHLYRAGATTMWSGVVTPLYFLLVRVQLCMRCCQVPWCCRALIRGLLFLLCLCCVRLYDDNVEWWGTHTIVLSPFAALSACLLVLSRSDQVPPPLQLLPCQI